MNTDNQTLFAGKRFGYRRFLVASMFLMLILVGGVLLYGMYGNVSNRALRTAEEKQKVDNRFDSSIDDCRIERYSTHVPCKIVITFSIQAFDSTDESAVKYQISEILFNEGYDSGRIQLFYTQGTAPFAIITTSYGMEQSTGARFTQKYPDIVTSAKLLPSPEGVGD